MLKKHTHKVQKCATSLEFTSSDHLLVLMELNLDVGGPSGSRDGVHGFQRQQVKRDFNQVKRDKNARSELERAINGVLEQHGRVESLLAKVVDGSGLDMSVVSEDIEALMEEVKTCVNSVLPESKRSSVSKPWFEAHRQDLKELCKLRRLAYLRAQGQERTFRKWVVFDNADKQLSKACGEFRKEFWDIKAAHLKELADRHDFGGFFREVNSLGEVKKSNI